MDNPAPACTGSASSQARNRLTSAYVGRPEEFDSSDFYDSDTARCEARSQGIYGKYRTILWGRFVLGPGRINLCITLLCFIGVLVLMILQYPVMFIYKGPEFCVMSYIVWFLNFTLLLVTALRDPGIMPRNIGYADHSLNYPRNLFRELGLPPRYCAKCSIRRPPRTYHCSICNICIRYQEMHIGMLGTCIGERNFPWYFCLNIYLLVFSLEYLVVYNAFLINAIAKGQIKGFILWDPQSVLTLCLLVIGVVIALLPQLGLPAFFYRFYLIAKDRTLREEFRVLLLGANTEQARNPSIKKCYCSKFCEYMCPEPSTQSYFAYRNQVSQRRGARRRDQSTSFGIGHSEQNLLNDLSRFQSNTQRGHKRSHTTDLFGNVSSAKRKAVYSLPMLNDGEVGKLPSTRPRHHRSSRPKDTIASKLVLYQELAETPRAIVDQQVHQQQNFNASLSLGDMPRATWNQSAENEIVYQARARQIQRVVDLVQRRDRHGLVSFGRRVNIGGLMGVQVEDPDYLQIIELNNNGTPLLGGRRAARHHHNRGGVGISQLVAAGYMSRLDGSIVREMVPPVLPPLPARVAPPRGHGPIPQPPVPVRPFLSNLRSTSFRNNSILSDSSMVQGSTNSPPATTPNFHRSHHRPVISRNRSGNEARIELDRARILVVGQRSENMNPRGAPSGSRVTAAQARMRIRSRSRSTNTNRDGTRNQPNTE